MKLPEESLSGTWVKEPFGRSSAVGLSERGEGGELDRWADEEIGLNSTCLAADFGDLPDVSLADSTRLEGERFLGKTVRELVWVWITLAVSALSSVIASFMRINE